MENLNYEVKDMTNSEIGIEIQKILNYHMLDYDWYAEFKREEMHHYAQI